jgi:hypothetical protein
MMETISINFSNGFNNKARAVSIPEGYSRTAINVDLDVAGKLRKRGGYTRLYTGDCHSVWQRYFVEDGDLKYLNSDNTATVLKTGVGGNDVSYTKIANRIYFCNGSTVGSIINSTYREWGLSRPSFQPTATARPSGGLFGGDYQTAITWLYDGEESGTGIASRTTVADGGGLRLSDFPQPPDYITKVAVYVSSVDSEDMYLYDEYPADVTEMFINKKICTLPLATQFGTNPLPFDIVQGHYGRLYGTKDRYVYYSNPRNYGLFSPRSYWVFPTTVTCLISVPGVIYVGTSSQIYRISNIDGQGPVQRTVLKEYGIVPMRNVEYDTGNDEAFFRSTEGDCVATSEGITELTAENVAMDEYGSASMTLVDSDGIKKLIGVSQNIVTASPFKAAN